MYILDRKLIYFKVFDTYFSKKGCSSIGIYSKTDCGSIEIYLFYYCKVSVVKHLFVLFKRERGMADGYLFVYSSKVAVEKYLFCFYNKGDAR